MQNVVPKFSSTPGSVDHLGPGMGAHNDEIYGRGARLQSGYAFAFARIRDHLSMQISVQGLGLRFHQGVETLRDVSLRRAERRVRRAGRPKRLWKIDDTQCAWPR